MIDDGCNIVFEHVPLFFPTIISFFIHYKSHHIPKIIEIPMFLNNNYLSKIMKWFKTRMTF
jgi:hypothetical protein